MKQLSQRLLTLFVSTFISLHGINGQNDRGFTPVVNSSSPKRIALVIGNSAYSNITTLANPTNDADDIAATLKQLGFEKVILKKNLSYRDFNAVIRDFGNQITSYDAALFYYAGHGIEVGENYLLPVDVPRTMQTENFKWDCISLDWIREKMNNSRGANKDNIVIVDASRNNPFRSFRSGSDDGWGASRIQCSNVITFYSTSSTENAQDGYGRNSPFAAILTKNMKDPGVEIREVFRRTRIELKNKYNQLAPTDEAYLNQFYFMPVKSSVMPVINNNTPDGNTSSYIASQISKANSYYDAKEYDEAFKILYKYKDDINITGEGLNILGYIYSKRYGVTQDLTEAVKWYRKSAEQGNAQGQSNLGYMYQYGYGVTKDNIEAVKWYQKARDNGDSDGCNKVKELSK